MKRKQRCHKHSATTIVMKTMKGSWLRAARNSSLNVSCPATTPEIPQFYSCLISRPSSSTWTFHRAWVRRRRSLLWTWRFKPSISKKIRSLLIMTPIFMVFHFSILPSKGRCTLKPKCKNNTRYPLWFKESLSKMTRLSVRDLRAESRRLSLQSRLPRWT